MKKFGAYCQPSVDNYCDKCEDGYVTLYRIKSSLGYSCPYTSTGITRIEYHGIMISLDFNRSSLLGLRALAEGTDV